MSLHGFQSALAYVIRSFELKEPPSVNDLAFTYELTADERTSLDNVINQQRLKAYSEELFLARWTIIREALLFLRPFMDFLALTKLWEEDFELKSKAIVSEDLALRFTDYLVHDEKGRAFIDENTQPFVKSLVHYTNMIFTFKHNYLPQREYAPHSCLTDRYFAIIKLDYDVREFFAELVELENPFDTELSPPQKSPITLLFVATDHVCEFRSFEIDHKLEQFLTDEINGVETSHVHPSFYKDLVELGICKGNTKKRACCSHH